MAESRAGAQISRKAFTQSVMILLVLMIFSGLMTRFIPAGKYERTLQDGRLVVLPDSYQAVERPDYPVWRWLTAPVEVLWSDSGLTIIVIIVFLLMVGASFAVLDKSGILKAALVRIVNRFKGKRYLMLSLISLFFMLMGAFFGIFEEVVPLVPVVITLSYVMGWDALVGLGMSILAVNLGFSAAITNPFTIGIAQNLAGLPLFSGAGFRVLIFISIYLLMIVFLISYAKRIEKNPEASLVFTEESNRRLNHQDNAFMDKGFIDEKYFKRSIIWLVVFLALILMALLASPFLPGLSDVSLPLVGLLFLAAGIGAGILSGSGAGTIGKAVKEGLLGIAPGIPLILMAASIKHIVTVGGILDTILNQGAQAFDGASGFPASMIIYFLALFVEFFIGSASAKAFLLMPILLPLADLVGVTRQIAVTAYCFGDGFSNLAYPTNPVLLIVLGLTVVSYPKWMRWTLKLWLGVLVITASFLALATAIQLGPF